MVQEPGSGAFKDLPDKIGIESHDLSAHIVAAEKLVAQWAVRTGLLIFA